MCSKLRGRLLICKQIMWSCCRVPDECPQEIMNLYLACTSAEAYKRPSAKQVMTVVELSLLAIPGARKAKTKLASDQIWDSASAKMG